MRRSPDGTRDDRRVTAPVLLHIYPTFAVGGAQARFAAIANHFGRRWHHAIVALDGVTDCRERLDPGLDVSFPVVATKKGDTRGNVLRYRAFLREMRPQTLVTANWGAIEWDMANALRPVARHIHVEDGFGPEERSMQLKRRVLTRRLVLRSCTTVLPSRNLLRIAEDIWKLPKTRLRYIPNGIDLTRFQPTAPSRGVPVIGTVAALRAEKNIARLLRAFALVSDLPARLVIIGDGPERAALTAQAEALGLADRVTFTGHQTDPASLIAGFDIFAMSSDTEQMPLSLLEAMASGVAVAATGVGDIRAMLPVENQQYVVPCDDTALANALRSLLANPAKRAAAGAANRARAEQDFGQGRMFEAYAALFDGLVS
jgi:glycosyltransferase involved in cell wall biosynthesis